jgi:glucokinase
MAQKILLAADVGGTKTNMALYTAERGLHNPVSETSLSSGEYDSFDGLLHRFYSKNDGVQISSASLAVAGPVVRGKASITSLQWEINENVLKNTLGTDSVWLMNDLVATARYIPHLRPEDVYAVHDVEQEPGGAKAIIAPGTGLGEAYLTWDGDSYHAYGSEGGHVDFAPADRLQEGLFEYLRKRFEHVSYERVCSGRGLPNIYEYLESAGYGEGTEEFRNEFANTVDPTPLIIKSALDETASCDLCRKTLELFVAVLGAAAGNLALKFMATGGVYLGGGIPPRILHAIDDDNFKEAFWQKGRMTDLLKRIPVYVILNPKAALLGAAAYGLHAGEK